MNSNGVALAVAFALTSSGYVRAADSLEEVVVESTYTTRDRLDTATGLGLTILETPQSVSVMTFERIADQNLRSLSDVVINAPGVSGKLRDSSRHAFSARGFTIDNYQIDGVPMEWSSGGDAGETETDTALYERIEIVRGATGLLTGAGNPSASINLVRKHADSKELTGVTTLGFGRWNQRNAMVDVSSPLALDGRVRGRAVLNYEENDSFVRLLSNKKSVGYAVIDADVTDRTLVRAGFSYQDNDPTASTWGGLASWYADDSRTDFSRSQTIGARWTRWASTNRNYFATVRQQLSDRWDLHVDYNNARNDGELNLLYLYGNPDRETGLGLFPIPLRSDTSREQYNISLRLTGNFDLFGRTHELIAGYSYTDQSYFADNRAPVAGTVDPIGNFNNWDGSYREPTYGAVTIDVDQDTKQSGFYVATRFTLADPLKIVAGGRLAKWEQRGVSYGNDVDFGDSNVFIPYAGALYDVTDAHRLYASYTEIFKPQDHIDRYGRQLDPLVGRSYELGLKSALLSGALHTTFTVFRIEQDNLAQPDPDGWDPDAGIPRQPSRAAQGTQSEGFEIEVVGRPLPGWEASLSYTNFTAKDAQNVAVNTDQPRKLLKLFTTYQFLDTLPGLTIGGGLYWEGGNYMDVTITGTEVPDRLTQDAYTLVNVMARYAFSEHLSAQLNVDNLLDETYYSQIGFFSQLAFGEPRNYNVGITYRF
ncbi:TonB-dependent siderophore receptor [Steroidobacter cummioxidans]|uniref:TonB-dependent siderophore receptor n=1 Tax=Steroidobacter cummioxidans TaxID=1803913 RepID=UPI000E32347A|nr:TonB-dependent siderophore receptor [Steroidobacter cummioxidans]